MGSTIAKYARTLLALSCALGASSAVLATSADNEIMALIAEVKRSDCTFIRNGSEHNSAEAAEHMEKKFDYYKNRIRTAEDFIRLAATGSAVSGKPYEVGCPNAPVTTSAAWLKRKLADMRRHASDRR